LKIIKTKGKRARMWRGGRKDEKEGKKRYITKGSTKVEHFVFSTIFGVSIFTSGIQFVSSDFS
jgi:hypothetical protein